MTLSFDDVQHLISLSADGDVPITKGSWSLPKLAEIFKKNLYQDENFFNSIKTGGQGNSLSLVKLVIFYAGKLEKYNDSIQNERPAGKKKKAMSAGKKKYNDSVHAVVWDPYRTERRFDRDFNENTFINGLTSSPDHIEPIYPNRVVRQFARIQPIPKNPKFVEVSRLRTWDGEEVVRQFARIQPIPKNPKFAEVSRLRTWDGEEAKQYKPKYDWVDMEVSGELPIICEHEQYVMLRNKNKALVEQISALKEEVQKMKDQKKQENENEKLSLMTKKLTEKATKYEQLRVRIEQMKEDRILNDVVHEQYVKSFEKLPAKLEEKSKLCKVLNDCNECLSQELAKKTKDCQVLNVQNTKLVEDLRIKIGVDASNPSLAIELAKQRRECKLLQDINVKLAEQSERQHPELVPYECLNLLFPNSLRYEAWHQAMKKEFHSGELAEKDDPTFIKLFDKYIRFYTIAQQGPKGDYQEDFAVMGGNQDKLMEVRRANVVLKNKINETLFQLYEKYHLDVMNSLESLMAKDPAFWKSVISQSLDTHFSSRCEMVYEQLCRACSYGGQHMEYRHMGHLFATCYEKVVVSISNYEAYTFLPLFWLRKNNHISNEKRFENLVGDTTTF
ncbi:hypothetical protein GIB67_037880 [Kingdonia uniflora]|uniref:Uncharacterized protein n=1 Tax=Kingdonia uniflora TaxID=39325 RepID=A0A7J7LH56_9MAGN|nr:hypothetical protein GIB67_037880 [Kingdonia uniflora]